MSHPRTSQSLSLTARITLLFALGSALVLIALGLLIAKSVDMHFEEQDVESLSGKLELAGYAIASVDSEAALDRLPATLAPALIGHDNLVLKVLGPQGEILIESGHAGFPDTQKATRVQEKPFRWHYAGRSFRGLTRAVPSAVPGWPAFRVTVALDIAHHEHFMQSFRKTLWMFVTTAALLCGLLGWLATRRGLRTLAVMEREANAITPETLRMRLSVDAAPPELAELARTVNRMLGRLEEAFARLVNFSSEIAHELRTPVSTLATQTQVSLSKTRSADEYREVLYASLEEYERMAQMISDMLFLAQTDNGVRKPDGELIDLAQEAGSLFDYFEAWSDERGVRLSLSGHCPPIFGDRLMLRRALSNLLSNAIRHTATGEQVRVDIAPHGQSVCVAVCNPGPDIAAEHLPRLFERFYRVDPSRQREGAGDSDGAGLGLAIVKSIINAHTGKISVTSANGLTCFKFDIPLPT